MVIVKSKITGKFLKRHSGSYHDFRRRTGHKTSKAAQKELGLPRPSGPWNDPEVKAWQEAFYKIQGRLCHERMFSGEALEARVYANPGSALVSVGAWNRDENGKVTEIDGRLNRLQEHLELHEIVAGNLCIVDVNDSEEDKKAKAKDCK